MRQDGQVSSNPAPSDVTGDQAADVQATVPGTDAEDRSQTSDVISDAVDDSGTAAQDAVSAGTGPVVVVLDGTARDLARSAAVMEAGNADHIGDLLVALAEDDVAITATFAARQVGYLGWHWSVTLAVLEPDHPTVSEVVLLPGDGALLAPAWIPWDQRIRPGDLGVGDLLPPIADDPRLVPAYLQNDDPAVEVVARELGIGRVRVLSREGRVDFAERLHDGSFGPTDDMALAAPAQCVTCAFYLPLAGSLGQLLGGCGNELAPADGRVVDAAYGCGAHSESVIEMPARSAAADTVIDELTLEVHRRPLGPSRHEAAQNGETASPTGVPESDQQDTPDADEVLLDEWADPYAAGRELAEVELAEAALLDWAAAPDSDTATDPTSADDADSETAPDSTDVPGTETGTEPGTETGSGTEPGTGTRAGTRAGTGPDSMTALDPQG